MPPAQAGVLDAATFRPPGLLNLVSHVPVTVDSVQWARETYTLAAAAVAAAALTGTSGTKPEAGEAFELFTAPIRTFAAWIAATKRIMSDATQLRGLIDNNLAADLRVELETQVIAGDGTGENFLGILNDPAIQIVGNTGGLNELDVLRRTKRMVRVAARTIPNAVVVSPVTAEGLETQKATTSGTYFGGGPFGPPGVGPVWGMPIVESEAIPDDHALVGDFRQAVLFDRESTNMSVGTAFDDFIRNIVRVLAETRAGFAITRPKAFVYAHLTGA